TDGGVTLLEAGRLIALSDQPHVARQLAARAVKAGQPKSVGDMLTALAFFQEGRFDSASVYATAALAEAPAHTQFDRLAAEYFEAAGRFDSSLQFSRSAWQRDS